ncbi:MAG: SUMF1/EgtB/PvdO family nonheme iron enzyme [Prolixibacteraceae bacterium]|jgi:formylglycine-generating enzyme required for sulfatase activity/nitrate/TMAO reductase-like tetraheme cytochrome c subunit|nr:SUMF1/EgtB/PvdO family nonheme iron enzyme [Prolixibacteraceae bacterium]
MADRKLKRKHYLLLGGGGLIMLFLLVIFNVTMKYTSSNNFCMACHVHPDAESAWMLSNHHNTSSGFSTDCVDCHLPPEDQPVNFIVRKAYHGFHDFYFYLTKDADEIDWEGKRNFEASKRFVYEDGCKKCHTNLFPSTLDALGSESHLTYVNEPGKSSCVQCHLDVGHYRGEPVLVMEEAVEDSSVLFMEPAYIDEFKDFNEQIPGTSVSFKMIAVEGGTFKMGSPVDEPYRKVDEGPVREVEVKNFWMSEVEITWNEYFAFFNATGSQGRKEADSGSIDEETDGITGATPPWGAPDQGWGMGTRPAITMTHHAAQTYCRWLSSVTGKEYRLPTEAEWEYAARGGTSGPYFFEGSPRDYEEDRFWNKIFGADTTIINSYVIYQGNSPNRTQPPVVVKPNPFGLKNMLGNVAEFCLDYYDPQVYSKYPQGVVKNPRGPREGLEHVVRGGSFKNSAKDLRVAKRDFTMTRDWLVTDPQIPKSIWWYSDCNHVGFRVVCEYDPDYDYAEK